MVSCRYKTAPIRLNLQNLNAIWSLGRLGRAIQLAFADLKLASYMARDLTQRTIVI
ncbi:hypothetical protein MPL3356_550007 [Mesorhizobium plurifarium]|uniref:Uncharacterized protein n=1 Tax=Mesorhizobium plurifarium TaxID=69974 RepID=A0A090E6V8_MESPL|nr:hypothetical protein MPL3356_550007 [Mesorhizobium plurifarium]